MKTFWLILLLLIGGAAGQAQADTVPVPPFSSRLIDLTRQLSPIQQQRIDEAIGQFDQKTGGQLAVLMLPTTGADSIEQYAIRVFDVWKLGDKQRNDGVLVIVALNDRAVRIEVGYGLEGAIPDAVAGRIIRDNITPYFREGSYGEGILRGVSDLTLAATGQPISSGAATPSAADTDETPAPAENKNTIYLTSSGVGLWLLAMVLLPLLVFRRRTLFARASKCALVITAGDALLDAVGEQGLSPANNYVFVFAMSGIILVFWFIFTASITGKQLVGTFRIGGSSRGGSSRGGGSSGGGGGSSGGGGASGRW
ncbi:TPM domain-containing protein [Brenneria populi subsp. brevivirga]|uniref:TPM domain-containing protein n=1 Tax=Brenneria populi TaxID=1505588 RepID=UPI002E1828C2|nr:TPM domain-containing protein [Brenneria populi subsp. brevivirga]